MLRYVTIKKFAEESGYSERAIRGKVHDGVWLKDAVWVKAPDGRILIDVEGYYAWVEDSKVPKPSVLRPARSRPTARVHRGKNLSPPPLV